MVEGARLESVCTGYRTEGSNPSLSATKSAANSGFFIVSLWDRKFGSCAMEACEPGQVRKEAALSGYFHVPRGSPDLRPYREASSAEQSSALFLLPKNLSVMDKKCFSFLVGRDIIKFSDRFYN